MAKNKGGRPPLYTSNKELSDLIDDYFVTDAFMGEGDDRVYAPTMSGLAYHLGMCRKSLINYENKDMFLHTIKKARDKVAVALEQRLYGNNVTGIIFNLKNNFGWKDKKEIDTNIKIGLESLSDEELTAQLLELRSKKE